MCESASANRAGTPRWRNDDGPFGEKCSRGRPSGKDGRLSFPGKVLASNDKQQTKKGKEQAMSTKYELKEIYTFKFSRIAFWNDVRYIVLKDPETDSETMPGYEAMKWVFRVPTLPFQCEWDNGCEWPEFKCRVVGYMEDCGEETTFPVLCQNMTYVNAKLYGEADADVPLHFEVVPAKNVAGKLKLRNPATNVHYPLLVDNFDDDAVSVGQFVAVYPSKKDDGSIYFISSAKHERNREYLKRKRLVPELFPVDGECECVVVPSGDSKFINVKHADADWIFNVSPPRSGVLPTVGETVRLVCTGHSSSYWPRFSWADDYARGTIPVDTLPLLDLPSGGESKYVEYKSSLVYPAEEVEPDVDKQLGQVIVRAVASFMNSDGGCVYVGVRDNGEICGIESECAFLTANSEDANRYKQNIDGIQLKVLNTIRQKLGDAAGALVEVRFKQGANTKHLVCEIVVRANETEIPIYADGKYLYVRYSGQTQRLEGESAAKYIIDRLRRLDAKRSGQKGIDSADAIEAMVQKLSKSLVAVQPGGKEKKPATILGRQVVVADDTSVPLEKLHVTALTRIGGLIFDGKFVGEAKTWGDLYVQLLRQLAKVDPEKFEDLPDAIEFRGRGNRPAFARKGTHTRLRDASEYLGPNKNIKVDRRDGTRTGFYEPTGYPIRLIKHFGLGTERFRIWTGK